MNFVFSPEYLSDKEKYVALIKNFDNLGKDFGNSRRNEIKKFNLEGEKIVVKSFKVPNIINKVAYKYLRKSKARRSFENATYLKEHNLGTPAPIAYAEEEGLLYGSSYYLCEEALCQLTIRELIHDPGYPDRENILREFARFTFKLHENNVNFLDHSPGNSLIEKTPEGYRFSLVDLNRMEFKTMGFEDRMKNFHRITPSREMAVIIANEYSKLIPQEESLVFDKLWGYIQEFQKKALRKKRLKAKLGL
ncbi:Kdo domain containing protein [Salegentibacter sp. LM13S]|uniref:lipopolysaccharide kinase InaA family protein n=1 Tax=Salegentibacter lacus TaxID=2873599 RepID=UPI001CCDE602|nr:lipopolysaccharide kinase InaA family protein [Salegentibacter lacus]MBZ9630590.1 Kdo domain containing protein [Salegentibacter lacus]